MLREFCAFHSSICHLSVLLKAAIQGAGRSSFYSKKLECLLPLHGYTCDHDESRDDCWIFVFSRKTNTFDPCLEGKECTKFVADSMKSSFKPGKSVTRAQVVCKYTLFFLFFFTTVSSSTRGAAVLPDSDFSALYLQLSPSSPVPLFFSSAPIRSTRNQVID